MTPEPDADFAVQMMERIETDYAFTGRDTAYVKLWHDEDWVGIHEFHLNADGRLCYGFVAFDTPAARAITTESAPKWQVESFDPLTLSPSLLCRRCGHHGFLRKGAWEAC